jgi:hypothetical protein
MSMRPLLLLTAVATLLSTSCSNELDVTAPYEENTVVYALLDKGTTTQFVKINKAFLGPDNALVYAAVPDSSEYTDAQLQAQVQEVKNGVVTATFPLQDTIMDHDPGIFAGPQHHEQDHRYRPGNDEQLRGRNGRQRAGGDRQQRRQAHHAQRSGLRGGGERKVGDPAKRQAITNPTNTISPSSASWATPMRRMQKEIARVPYKVVRGEQRHASCGHRRP